MGKLYKKNKNKAWFATTEMEADQEEEVKAVEDKVEAVADEQTDAQKLGIFGNIIRALVVANTWRS